MSVVEVKSSIRNFNNFLEAYYNYALDDFCPNKFHFWAGISLIAGALERKVWLNFQHIKLYPNMYIMLISKPGMGKSTAGNRSIRGFLSKVEGINFIPEHVTEAKMIDLLHKENTYTYGGREVKHSSMFWYMSEASNSLKELAGGGDIIPAITDFYDCPDTWSKSTMKDGDKNFNNICFNILAGCTFDFLNELIMGKNVFGGFASRNLYVVHDEVMVRNPAWDNTTVRDTENEQKILEDLRRISSLKGSFRVDKSVKESFKEWFPKNDRARQNLNSMKLQAFLVRRHTNILKLCMIFSVADSDDLIIRQEHWDKALKVVEILEENLPAMISAGEVRGQTQKAVKEQILNIFRLKINQGKENVVTRDEINKSMVMDNERMRIDNAVGDLVNADILGRHLGLSKEAFYLIFDPQDKL